jgi:hypothetical protein
MKTAQIIIAAGVAALACSASLIAPPLASAQTGDPIGALVGRLDLERYKATIKGLAQFGDRRQGTDRNRAAVEWIARELASYGCTVERLHYVYDRAPEPPSPLRPSATSIIPSGEFRPGLGGARLRGVVVSPVPNNDPSEQTDPALRALNAQLPTPGPREEVFCTKVGATHPEEMYVIGGHMDGRGFGEAVDDDASGAALVMELARVFSGPDVTTDRSIRFVLWNNEETGLNGAFAYVQQRAALQGRQDPPGSGRYPEPKWLGMIQHDMMLWDHGLPRADGTVSAEQRAEADVNIDFQSTSKFADQAMKLAFAFREANEKYATDYPATVGPHMTNTDSTPFMDLVPAITLRENDRGAQIGAGSNPHYHQPSDRFTSYSDKDFRLGLNAAQTTLAGVAKLTGATLKK